MIQLADPEATPEPPRSFLQVTIPDAVPEMMIAGLVVVKFGLGLGMQMTGAGVGAGVGSGSGGGSECAGPFRLSRPAMSSSLRVVVSF